MKTTPTTSLVKLVDHLVGLSSIRDRDTLLRRITQAILDVTLAQEIEVLGLVKEETQSFWIPLTSATLQSGVKFLAEYGQVDADALVPLSDALERKACLSLGKMTSSPLIGNHKGWIARFPVLLGGGKNPWGMVEVTSTTVLSKDSLMAVDRLLSVYVNMLDVLDYSESDALTGLWNRKAFDDLFYKAISATDQVAPTPVGEDHRASAPISRFWLSMVDIDHFKQVNDRFGHLIGDEVLILVARIMKSCFRISDRVFRFGGEEFVVVLRCGDHKAATAALERFRARMDAYQFPQAGHISVSVGFTEIIHSDAPSAACERADQAVYYAKQHGRNQVCSESDLVTRGLLQSAVKTGDVELF